ncbi:hypothetical protein D9M68_742270 [compost metagenome]
MHFSRPHSGEETHREVVAVVGPGRGQDALHLIERERHDVAALDLQRLDVAKRGRKLEPVGRFIEDLSQRLHHGVDASVGQGFAGLSDGNFGE